jgi:hypothetical protein
MLTFFATGKAFSGHSGVIQRNALQSWKHLHSDAEVILFGDDPGAAETAAEFGLRHEPLVERNEFGSKRLDYMFARAQAIARHAILCYANCDIVLLPELLQALDRVRTRHGSFLMVGRRWDLDITDPLDFSDSALSQRLRERALHTGLQRGPDWVDYFAFPRGLYDKIPPLVVGRIWWDHWLTWYARQRRAAVVVDASPCVVAIHQNHDYGYHPKGATGVWQDEQSQRNYQLAGGWRHLYTIADATRILESDRERRNWFGFWAPYWRKLRPFCIPFWFGFLHITRPLRKLLGLRQSNVQKILGQRAKKFLGRDPAPQPSAIVSAPGPLTKSEARVGASDGPQVDTDASSNRSVLKP